MENEEIEKLLQVLKNITQKPIIIKQTGFISNQISIEKPIYTIEYDTLKLEDNQKENYVHINLNQVYQTEIKESEICLYLDNDTQIKIKDECN